MMTHRLAVQTMGAGANPVRALNKVFVLLGVAAVLAATQPVNASQLSLAQQPLFLTAHVPANIFFLADDSGSMDWQMVTSNAEGLFAVQGLDYEYLFPDSDNWSGEVLPTEAAVLATANMPADAYGIWRLRYHGYNKIFYNPEVNYKPWPGVDNAGNPLRDAKAPTTDPAYIAVTAVRLDAFNPGTGVVDLTTDRTYSQNIRDSSSVDVWVTSALYSPTYYTWTDSNSNGVIDSADAHTRYEIRTGGTCGSGATCPATFDTRAAARTDCAIDNGNGTRTCTATEELKNFANWYMYYRRRELTAKAAIGNVVGPKGSEVRMGHATLHNNSGASNIQITQMASSLTSGTKRNLLDAVYRTQAGSNTPLRTKLNEVGKYYECTNGSVFGNTGSYTCPILTAANGGNCQQNFTIAMTDGYYNDSFSGLGNVDADGASPNAAGNTALDGGAYADTYSNTLADIAMHYYERDLSALANDVPVISGVDDASHQHMVTYTVAFGVNGTLTAGPTDPATAFAWPDPFIGSNNPERIDDLRHAAYNGRGLFLNASDPQALTTALQDAIQSITDRTGSASAVAVNSRSLTSNTRVYQARFTSGEWSGDLRALPIDAVTAVVGAPVWSAKDVLKTQDWNSGRAIVTSRRTGAAGSCAASSGTEGGAAFRWNDLSDTQKCLLNDDPTTGTFDNDSRGSLRLNYLRGDASQEGTGANFRVRAGGFKLGDIANSAPIYVGTPEHLPDIEAVSHTTFRNTYYSRRPMVYIGGNDGMLHGFDANTGEEKLAYVPSMVYASLNQLTNPSYAHRYYVDGSPATADAFGNFANGCSSAACWRTVLVGSMAGGGKGTFALDVTDPDGAVTTNLAFSETNAANIVLWEFLDSASATPGNDMGYVYGEISIVKMQNGKWGAVFGNGYNSTNENAVLYIVDITNGSLIKKIELNPYGSATGNSNGLSAPYVVDKDGDLVADYIYAGDLRGNLWKVDVTSTNPNSWGSAYKQGSTPKPLFVAVDALGAAEAITGRPEVGPHPAGQVGYMVYFGTGRYLADGDKTPAASPINGFYGIWDKDTNTGSTPVARGDLLQQSIATQTTASGREVRVLSNNTADWKVSASVGTHLGCVLNLRTNQTDSLGEMSVTNPVLLGGSIPRVLFTTLIPESSACSYGGSGWLMEVSSKNCGNLPQGVIDVNGDGIVDSNDLVGGGVVSGVKSTIGIQSDPVVVRGSDGRTPKLMQGSSGAIQGEVNYEPVSSKGRQSWRQLR